MGLIIAVDVARNSQVTSWKYIEKGRVQKCGYSEKLDGSRSKKSIPGYLTLEANMRGWRIHCNSKALASVYMQVRR